MLPIEQFFPLLSKPMKLVITTHQKPDGDAMGSSLGLYHLLIQLGHEVQIISPTNWAHFLNWMPGVDTVIDFEANRELSNRWLKTADYIFCLDFNTPSRVKNLEQLLRAVKAPKILIDHHEQPETAAFAYGISEPHKSSTCEMIFDFVMSAGYEELMNQEMMTCIYTGILTDTGSFRFPSTSATVHQAVAKMKHKGLSHSIIHSHIFDNNAENRLRLLGHVLLNRMEVYYNYNTAFMYLNAEDIEEFDARTGDTEGVINYLLSIEGICFGAFVVDRGDERKWSFRSRGNFDVATFSRTHFEGGGHFNAAGGRSSKSLDDTIADFLRILPDYKEQLQ